MSDPIHWPHHYNNHPSGVECRELASMFGFCKGNLIKYLFRWKDKGDPLENLDKALKYIEFELESWQPILPSINAYLIHEKDDFIRLAMDGLLLAEYRALVDARGYITNLRSIVQEDVSRKPATEENPGHFPDLSGSEVGSEDHGESSPLFVEDVDYF